VRDADLFVDANKPFYTNHLLQLSG
jgi:hypothetical protein